MIFFICLLLFDSIYSVNENQRLMLLHMFVYKFLRQVNISTYQPAYLLLVNLLSCFFLFSSERCFHPLLPLFLPSFLLWLPSFIRSFLNFLPSFLLWIPSFVPSFFGSLPSFLPSLASFLHSLLP